MQTLEAPRATTAIAALWLFRAVPPEQWHRLGLIYRGHTHHFPLSLGQKTSQKDKIYTLFSY